jgi:hypothetical protein
MLNFSVLIHLRLHCPTRHEISIPQDSRKRWYKIKWKGGGSGDGQKGR